MRASIVAGSVLVGLLAAPLRAQQVAADVIVRGGPVAGRIVIADGYSSYQRRVVAYRRPPVRRIVVERISYPQFRRWHRHGFRRVIVYYVDGRYYDRFDGYRPGVREVLVYERDGRYYRDCDD
jgi:hypothetical protein